MKRQKSFGQKLTIYPVLEWGSFRRRILWSIFPRRQPVLDGMKLLGSETSHTN
jgi:hypothetical protein